MSTTATQDTRTRTGTKVLRTRARLLAAALELFAEQGYDETTVAQVAARAGVTEMTFYRHFGSKGQLVVADPYDPLIAAAVAAQPTHLPPLTRAVRGVRAAWRDRPLDDDAALRTRISIGAATPSLLPTVRASTAQTEAAVAEQLVAGGAEPSDAAICAAAVMGALTAALLAWAASGDVPLGAAVLRALDLLEAGR